MTHEEKCLSQPMQLVAKHSYWQLRPKPGDNAPGGVGVVLAASIEQVILDFPNTQLQWHGIQSDFLEQFMPYTDDASWIEQAIKRDWHYYFTYFGDSNQLGVC